MGNSICGIKHDNIESPYDSDVILKDSTIGKPKNGFHRKSLKNGD